MRYKRLSPLKCIGFEGIELCLRSIYLCSGRHASLSCTTASKSPHRQSSCRGPISITSTLSISVKVSAPDFAISRRAPTLLGHVLLQDGVDKAGRKDQIISPARASFTPLTRHRPARTRYPRHHHHLPPQHRRPHPQATSAFRFPLLLPTPSLTVSPPFQRQFSPPPPPP